MKFFFSLLFIVLLIWIAIAGGLLIERQREANKPQPIEFDFRGIKLGDPLPKDIAKKEKITGIGIEHASQELLEQDFYARVRYGLVDGKVGSIRVEFDQLMDDELELKYGKRHSWDSTWGSVWYTKDGNNLYYHHKDGLSIETSEYNKAIWEEIDADTKRRASKL